MKKQCQNVRSTKQRIVDDLADNTHHLSKQQILVKVINATQIVYTDQTGCFPVQSSRGNRLLIVLFDVDGNYVDVETMKDNKNKKHWQRSKQQSEKTATYSLSHQMLTAATWQNE